VIFCDEDFIKCEHLPENIRPAESVDEAGVPSSGNSLKDAVKNFERQFILQTLVAHHQNKEVAARALGVSLSSLYRKIEDLQIQTK
jgi:transcriptional regulator with PAS, ATPase and Fis domain